MYLIELIESLNETLRVRRLAGLPGELESGESRFFDEKSIPLSESALILRRNALDGMDEVENRRTWPGLH